MMFPFAQLVEGVSQSPSWSEFWRLILYSASFGIVGIVLLLGGYWLFELVTPRLNIQKELEEKNMAVGVVVAALLLGIAYIAAHVVK